MNLYQNKNPNPNAGPQNAHRQPVCLTNPFCSQKACDKSLSISARVAALLKSLTLEEKISNVVDAAAGASRIGLPPYEWWSEALHGVAGSPGVTFNQPNGSAFSYATSFPNPILMGAAFDDALIGQVASVIGKEARAFANYEQSGFDFWTPNINTFLDPRWGRGLEVASEDSFHMQNYVRSLIPGLQGGMTGSSKQIIATCKHYAVYDVETNRNGQNYDPTQQDLGEYYLRPFKTCVRDAGVGSIMCSYNAVDGVPSCASEYLLQTLLRDDFSFDQPYHYVTSDCDAVSDIFANHHFVDSASAASAVALNAGTDLDCGTTYSNLNESIANKWTTEETLDKSLGRLYQALFTVGYFDGQPQYDGLAWSDVGTGSAQSLAYQAAWEGMTLLKNDGLLPLKTSYRKVALIGPWANATTQMQGNYQGTAPYLKSPLEAAQASFGNVNYVMGTNITSTDTNGVAEAIATAQGSGLIIFMGGIDTTVEAEGNDRETITWPSNQLDLIQQLSQLGKPLAVVQFGGGQVDDTELLHNKNVTSILWAGYPGQDGGYAVLDILTGKKAPAGRLTTTQYPSDYVNQVSIFDPNLRPSSGNPGRTYKWYTGKPVLPFGYGLHYTNFNLQWTSPPRNSYDIRGLLGSHWNHGGWAGGHPGGSQPTDASPFITVRARVKNTGRKTSDYTLELPLTLGSIARANENGDLVIYPGDYEITLDVEPKLKSKFRLTGPATVLEQLPRQAASYNYTVPVHPQ
ncbi:hypothetical protein PRZ48_005742 [Zasmidium cellare]|uniref:xylan 1,4-beta-xylosidase n=1 Tax=Zasmidium cellare TaxID=395010 RepID=A0ABR0ELG5_ZASCE|nr:hypothetical protein PRZ48_005742 [Zasmidium cellare]